MLDIRSLIYDTKLSRSHWKLRVIQYFGPSTIDPHANVSRELIGFEVSCCLVTTYQRPAVTCYQRRVLRPGLTRALW